MEQVVGSVQGLGPGGFRDMEGDAGRARVEVRRLELRGWSRGRRWGPGLGARVEVGERVCV